jgi:hypothetical protein
MGDTHRFWTLVDRLINGTTACHHLANVVFLSIYAWRGVAGVGLLTVSLGRKELQQFV